MLQNKDIKNLSELTATFWNIYPKRIDRKTVKLKNRGYEIDKKPEFTGLTEVRNLNF